MSRCFDRETMQHLTRVHRAYKAFVALTPVLSKRDLHYAYALFLQSSFGDYKTKCEPSICIRAKCLGLKLCPPEPYYHDWQNLNGMDADVACEKFNEYMGMKDVEYTKKQRLRHKEQRQITVVLPKDANDAEFIQLLHPKSHEIATFLHASGRLYELTAVNGTCSSDSTVKASNRARSIIFSHGWIESDASVLVCTPINPIYFVLGALFECKERFMSVEDLHDVMETKTEGSAASALPFKLLSEKVMGKCCEGLEESGVTMYRLDVDKLVNYLNQVCDRVVEKTPHALVNRMVTVPLTPVDMSQQTPEEMTTLAMKKLGVGLVSSYLDAPIIKLWEDKLELKELDEYLNKLTEQRQEAQRQQEQMLANTSLGNGDAKRSQTTGPEKKKPAAGTKARKVVSADTKTNKSIKSFFSKK